MRTKGESAVHQSGKLIVYLVEEEYLVTAYQGKRISHDRMWSPENSDKKPLGNRIVFVRKSESEWRETYLCSLRNGVLSKLSGEDEADGGLDLAGGDGRLLVVRSQLGGLGSDTLEDVWKPSVIEFGPKGIGIAYR